MIGSKDTGFCYMVAFFINFFSRCAFGAITNNARRFKSVTIWFYNIVIINVDDRFCWNPFFNLSKISRCRFRNQVCHK